MLSIDPKKVSTGKLHGYLLGAVAPRPIAFASTIDADGNPVSITFNVGVKGATSVLLDVRVAGVSQRTFTVSSGYFQPSALTALGSGFAPSGGGPVSVTSSITPTNPVYYEQMETVSLVVNPSAGSKSIQVYAKTSGGISSGPLLKNRFLETTELKR